MHAMAILASLESQDFARSFLIHVAADFHCGLATAKEEDFEVVSGSNEVPGE